MGRPRRPVVVVPWVRSTEAPLPDAYRHNFVIRDPELIAFLVRGVPHGQLTKAMERLMREGYDRMVATSQIDPSNHLTASERAFIRSGQRKADKTARADPDERAPTAVPSFRVPGAAPAPPPARGNGAAALPPPVAAAPATAGVPPAPAPAAPGNIGDDDANVLLGAAG